MGDYKVAVLPPEKRTGNFSEVIVGLNKRQAVEHAKLYLQKEAASSAGQCPLGTDLFGFVRLLADGNIQSAFDVIRKANPFPSITGRLFQEPDDHLHVFDKEGNVVSVRMLERFVGDNVDLRKIKPLARDKNAAKVAVIGSGPAGLTAAVKLAEKGNAVTVFDSMHKPGGALRYGYPDFRLPKKIVDRQVQYAEILGVNFELNKFFGVSFSVDDLVGKNFDSVLIATGAGLIKPLNLPGVNFAGVVDAPVFLERVNSAGNTKNGLIGPKVAVIGGGNAAFDCARSAVRLGAEVRLISRGTQDEYGVRQYVVDQAFEEGVEFEPLVNTLEILGDRNECVRGLKCRRYDYVDEHDSGVWSLSEIEDSDFEVSVDTVIIAAGHAPNALFARHDENWRLHSDQRIWTQKDSSFTAQENVFACGNIVDGPGPVVDAMLSAFRAVNEIDRHLKSGK